MLPREKALNYGIRALNNNELLALIIKSGFKDKTVFQIADDLILKANGFENLLSLSYEELIQIKGIKKAKGLEILAILEVARRLSKIDHVSEEELRSPNKIAEYVRFKIGFSNVEEFMVIFLNHRGVILKSEVMFKGTKSASLVGVDEVMRKAILLKASAIVVCHNHPSGSVEPSKADFDITKNLYDAGKMMNIPLLDHLIISKNSFYSFKGNHLLC